MKIKKIFVFIVCSFMALPSLCLASESNKSQTIDHHKSGQIPKCQSTRFASCTKNIFIGIGLTVAGCLCLLLEQNVQAVLPCATPENDTNLALCNLVEAGQPVAKIFIGGGASLSIYGALQILKTGNTPSNQELK